MTNEEFLENYWTIVCEIWELFQSGQIGMKKRDQLLEPHRLRLRQIMLKSSL